MYSLHDTTLWGILFHAGSRHPTSHAVHYIVVRLIIPSHILNSFLLEVTQTRGFKNMLFSHWSTENLLKSYWLRNSRFSKLHVLETLGLGKL